MGKGSINPRHWQWHYGGPDVLSPEEEAELEAGDEEFQEFHEMDVGQNGRPRGPQMLV